ncbi:hypothetical protein Bca4012_024840 [Brassica carinata]
MVVMSVNCLRGTQLCGPVNGYIMEDLGLPSRLFESGYEPYGRKRVNSYFHLRWIDILKPALEDDQLEMLNESQFGRILKMGGHTFSVMFLHYLLSRQLVTQKEFELWWLFVGKPIRYAIQDFAFVTGLNCGQSGGLDSASNARGIGRGKVTGKGKSSSSTSIWDELFRGEEKPTVSWIMDRLVKGKRYKDPLTRLRLALLVLVEGILCPTCGTTNIRPEVVNRLGNIDEFVKYPWGRESFLLTVRSAKARTPEHYIQETMALQGFTHAMVLVAITACPSIIVKAGGGDPLADSSLSTSDIISLLVDRKLAVNPVSTKGVDQLGQADVRYYVCDDADGELLSRGLGDQDDASVDNLVSLIEDDYPFEHNIWSGGVRADDVKANKGPASSPQSSGENVSSAVDKEKDMGGGGDSNMKSRERMDQSRRPPSFDPQPDENIPLDVPTLLRRAADAYEEKVLPMFEGYMLSLKGHFHTEVGTLRTDLQAIKTSVHDLETKVGVEFEKMKTLIKGGGFFDDEPYRGGGSPYRHDSPYEGGDDELPPAFVPPPHTTRMYSAPVGQASTSAPDVSASAEANLPIPSDGEAAAVHSAGVSCDEVTGAEVPRTESTDKTEAMNVDSATGQGGSTAVDRQPPLVTSPDPPPALPTEVPESSSIPDVSTVVTQILTESGILKGTQDLPPTASQPGKVCPPPSGTTQSVPLNAEDIVKSSTTPDKKTSGSSESSQSVGRKVQDKVSVVGQPHSAARVEDQSGGVVEKEAAVGGGSKKRPAESDAAAGVSTTADAGGDVERRHSKRTQKKTQKFTPPVPTVRKPATKKPPKAKESNAPAPKRSKKAGVESSQPNPAPTSTLSSRDLPVFIGGFNAFAPPSASNREAFLKRLALANPGSSISPLQDLFHCTGVCSHQALDRVVQCIRIRRDRLPAARFDFLPPSFFVELLHHYSGFEASNDKATFTFSSNLKDQFLHRPQWFKQVDFVYSPVLIKKSHWVGVILDLNMSAIYVVDFNQACPSEFDVVGVLTPISNMLPYLIQKHCITTSPRDLRFLPLPISRIEVPMLIEHPGYSGVAAIILLEHAAAGQPLMSLSVTEEEVRHAAENYAIAALSILHHVIMGAD